MPEEKRKTARVRTVNLLSYASMDNKGDSVEQGMGKALDIGQGGILMETKVPIKSQYILLTATDKNEELIKIKGEVAHCREKKPGVFHSGVRFIEEDNKIREVVAGMIKAFLETKKVNAESRGV